MVPPAHGALCRKTSHKEGCLVGRAGEKHLVKILDSLIPFGHGSVGVAHENVCKNCSLKTVIPARKKPSGQMAKNSSKKLEALA